MKLEEAALIFFPDLLKNTDERLLIPAEVVSDWPEIIDCVAMTGIGWCSPKGELYKSYASAIVFKRSGFSRLDSGYSAVLTKSITWDGEGTPSFFWIEDNTSYMRSSTVARLMRRAIRRNTNGDKQLFWKLI